MQPDSRRAEAPGLRPRTFALPQTTDARWLPIHLHALSSTPRCGIALESAVESQQFRSHLCSTFCLRDLFSVAPLPAERITTGWPQSGNYAHAGEVAIPALS